jgi:hypothetical protein
MSRRTGAILSALFTLAIFVGLPIGVLYLLPADLAAQLSQVGFSVQGLLDQTVIIGVVIAAITIAKGFIDDKTVTYLLLNLASNGITLLFTFIVLGLGNVGSMGLTTVNLNMENAETTVVMDMRLLLQVAVLTVVLKMIQAVLKWREARVEAAQKVNAPQPGTPTQ